SLPDPQEMHPKEPDPKELSTTGPPHPGKPDLISTSSSPSEFQPLRAGQFRFTRIAVVDRFGQSVDIVTPASATLFAPVVAEGLSPQGKVVLPTEPTGFVQLPPRLLQPERLNATFASATSDAAEPPSNATTNPVCAWILPNHLDQALACYDPGGAPLGNALVTTGTSGRQITWLPAPGGTYPTIASLTPTFPQLAEFLLGADAAGPIAFDDLLATIDATMWSIVPPATGDEQYLSVLIGRPLALARATLSYELAGPPLTDPAWQYTFAPQRADVLHYSFPVRLGDLGNTGDGLIGYFAGSDASRFLAVHRPASVTSPYITEIGPGSFLNLRLGRPPAPVTMLLDPQVPVHAFTDIFPMTTLTVPQRFTAPALEAMSVAFRAGPLVTDLLLPVTGEGPEVMLQRPTELNGTWSWIETDGTNTTRYGITPADQRAQFPATSASIRTGWLQLTGALGASNTVGG
ncbi:MAG: hypothetical protein ACRDU4_10275, partial [Mycobacterium sp.]